MDKRKVKPRKCWLCKKIYSATAQQIKTHYESCKGKDDTLTEVRSILNP